ncbi:hypothetical protein ACVWZ4_000009 [Bradyrhizobium sp. USDA 4472]
MPADIIPFPDPSAPMSEDERKGMLLLLHERLTEALMRDAIDGFEVTLDIDEIMELGRLIEQELGPDAFDQYQN